MYYIVLQYINFVKKFSRERIASVFTVKKGKCYILPYIYTCIMCIYYLLLLLLSVISRVTKIIYISKTYCITLYKSPVHRHMRIVNVGEPLFYRYRFCMQYELNYPDREDEIS